MLIKRRMPYFILALLLLPAFAFSQMQEIKEYKVRKGDTLWDISGSELKDPFLWPKIWKENPDIKNPDLIYPDQTVKIPLYLLHEEVAAAPAPEPVPETAPEPAIEVPPGPVKEEAIVAEPAPAAIKPLLQKNAYLASGFVGDLSSIVGTIDGHASGRIIFGNQDLVYVKLKGPVTPGDRYYIYHKGQKVIHPATGAAMGHVFEPVGILEVKRIQYGETIAEIRESFSEILIGDMLVPYYEMQPPVVEKPYRRPDIKGYVVATRQLKIMSGNNDIIYIDRGEKDGLQPGDIINTVAAVDFIATGEKGKHKVPNGRLQVISTRQNTSTAIILKTHDRLILPGNFLTKAE